MKTIKENSTIAKIDLQPQWNSLQIVIGERFDLFNGKLYVNTNPYHDARLEPIENINLENDILSFTRQKKDKVIKHEINLSTFPMARHLAELVVYINKNGLTELKQDKDWITLWFEDDKLNINLYDYEKETPKYHKTALIYGKTRGKSRFVKRFPEPSAYYYLKNISLNDHIVTINATGDPKETPIPEDTQYEWRLNIQPVLSEVIEKMILEAAEVLNRKKRMKRIVQ